MEKNYRSELVGCFGDPVDGNPTGVMEEAAFTACGLNYRYITANVCAGDLPAAFAPKIKLLLRRRLLFAKTT